MSNKRKPATNGTSHGAPIVQVEPAAPTAITRAAANNLLKTRAQELYHEASARREEGIRLFETEFGRSDRIDHSLLKDLQNLQFRFAAIAARQVKQNNPGGEPKVSRFTKQLGDIIGELSSHLATDRVLELFAPVNERDYLGVGGVIGRKGLDESVLAGYRIIDDPLGPKNVTPTAVDDEEGVCIHEEIEPYEDDPTHGACVECGEEFGINGASIARDAAEQDSEAIAEVR